jgi:hypothetical protein
MGLIQKQAGEQLNDDRDLRLPVEEITIDEDKDLRVLEDDEESPLSPPMESMDIPSVPEPVTSKPAAQPTLTMDDLSTLAALAGKGDVVGGLNLDLAAILSKVESAQSGSAASASQHVSLLTLINNSSPSFQQYSQEDSSDQPVIAQILPGSAEFQQQFYQQPQLIPGFNPSFMPRPRFPAPGMRSTTINPRGGFFHTSTNMTRFRTVPCKYFIAGTCNFGDNCRFLHTNPDGQVVPQNPPPPQQVNIQQIAGQEAEDTTPSFSSTLTPKADGFGGYSRRGRGDYRGRGRGFRGGYRRDYDSDRWGINPVFN